jgi:hypothetical protein
MMMALINTANQLIRIASPVFAGLLKVFGSAPSRSQE